MPETDGCAEALPALVLDHQGAVMFPDSATVKIPVTTPAETVESLARAIDDLRHRPEEVARLSQHALAAAHSFDWQRRAIDMTAIYASAFRRTREATAT